MFLLQFKGGLRDGLILLVDCSKSMFDKENDDDESFFQLCMRVCIRVQGPVVQSIVSLTSLLRGQLVK